MFIQSWQNKLHKSPVLSIYCPTKVDGYNKKKYKD